NVDAGYRASNRAYSWMESAGSPASPALWADSKSSFCSEISSPAAGGGSAKGASGCDSTNFALPVVAARKLAKRASSASCRSLNLRTLYQTTPAAARRRRAGPAGTCLSCRKYSERQRQTVQTQIADFIRDTPEG